MSTRQATRIGILSDSHGRAAVTSVAVRMLLERGATILIHLGDVGSESVIDELVGHDSRMVLGNCDWPREPLTAYARLVGVQVDDPWGMIEAGGRRIAFAHGHDARAMEQAIRSGCDYLLHGHTHEVRDERIGPMRVINPGALFRAARYTAAMLQPASDLLDLIEIPRHAETGRSATTPARPDCQ